MAYYSFTVRGHYPNGNKATMSGYLRADADYPDSAFDQAVLTCQDLTPGLVVDRAKPGTVTLRLLRKKPKGFGDE